MRQFVFLLLLTCGAYLGWYYLNNREKVWAKILARRHLLALAALVGIFLFFLVIQVTIHSTKLL